MVDVYADLLFLVDLCMDLACISATSALTGAESGRKRRFLAAALGALYSVLSLFIPSGLMSVACAVLSWQAVCLVAFYRRGDRAFRHIRISLCHLAVNALLGGGVSAVFSLLGELAGICIPEPEHHTAEGRLRIVFLALGSSCLLLRILVKRRKVLRVDGTESVRITGFGKSIVLGAICDTGNMLKEPLSGKPCTVISRADLIGLGGEALLSLLSPQGCEGLIEMGVKVTVVPAKTVSGDGIMPAFFTSIELLDSEGRAIKKFETAVAVSDSGAPSEGFAIIPRAFFA